MKKRAASPILLSGRNEVLLQLRDDIPTFSYPNTWRLPVGHIEGDKASEGCLFVRRVKRWGIELPHLTYFIEMR
jgi:hypothetical protein